MFWFKKGKSKTEDSITDERAKLEEQVKMQELTRKLTQEFNKADKRLMAALLPVIVTGIEVFVRPTAWGYQEVFISLSIKTSDGHVRSLDYRSSIDTNPDEFLNTYRGDIINQVTRIEKVIQDCNKKVNDDIKYLKSVYNRK